MKKQASHPAGSDNPAQEDPHGWHSDELTMTVLMTPDMANSSGNIHGGTILKYLDSVACASRYSGSCVVTLAVDQVMFLQPIHVGELVTFLASVNYTGRSAMEMGIRVVTETSRRGQFGTPTVATSRWWRSTPTASRCRSPRSP